MSSSSSSSSSTTTTTTTTTTRRLELPQGEVVVRVSMLNPVTFGPAELARFMAPPVPGLATLDALPSLCFLLEHPSGRKLVWDLGIRKDYDRYAPTITAYLPTTRYRIQVTHNVADLLAAGGVDLNQVEAVVWSHWHWDHIGDPSTFPPSTKLVVGRGFTQAMLPGAPANPTSPILESDYTGRELEEISFEGPSSLQIGQFPAYDYFGDGSFYLLDSPGHAIGHMCGLVRTTTAATTTTEDDSFLLLGSDVCHYAGILRPSPQQPLPAHITPHPSHPCPSRPSSNNTTTSLPSTSDDNNNNNNNNNKNDDMALAPPSSSFCPGHACWNDLQRSRGRPPTAPLFQPTFGLDLARAAQTIGWAQDLDGDERVLVVLAHDATVLAAGAPLFPRALNGWRAAGLGTRARWAFLRHLEGYWREKGF